jgi:hypothetical protein
MDDPLTPPLSLFSQQLGCGLLAWVALYYSQDAPDDETARWWSSLCAAGVIQLLRLYVEP